MTELEDRIAKQFAVLDRTLGQIHSEVRRHESDAKTQGQLHRWFTATLAVLAVAAPALVTYQTQNTGQAWLPFFVIGVTAIAGAGTSLQSAFRWGDRFRRTKLTALELSELYSATELERQDIEDTDDPVKVFSKISELNQRAAKALRTVVRNHIQAEVALIAPQPDARAPGGSTEKRTA
jgi:hypothetical protein